MAIKISKTKYCEQQLVLAQELAKSKNGKYIGGNYTDCKSQLQWMCDKGHLWQACWSNILSGKWCPICMRKMHTIDEINKSITNGCKCISEKYKNNVTKLEWKCSIGHIWLSTYSNSVRNNFNCPQCKIQTKEIIK